MPCSHLLTPSLTLSLSLFQTISRTFVIADLEMYDAALDEPCQVRQMAPNDELAHLRTPPCFHDLLTPSLLDEPCQVRQMALLDELGQVRQSSPATSSPYHPVLTRGACVLGDTWQVSHIFSDKTGTLTSNHMEFRCARSRRRKSSEHLCSHRPARGKLLNTSHTTLFSQSSNTTRLPRGLSTH